MSAAGGIPFLVLRYEGRFSGCRTFLFFEKFFYKIFIVSLREAAIHKKNNKKEKKKWLRE
jgi:hypothetical protein